MNLKKTCINWNTEFTQMQCYCALGIQNDLHIAIVLSVFKTKLKCL